jgi:hypothetical protein
MRRGPILLLSLSLAGCASTSGNDWLNSPVEAQPRVFETAEVASEAAPAPRPRLSHTVTLGESYDYSPRNVAAAPGAPPFQVNVHTPVTVNNYVGGYNYGSYGAYGYGITARSSGTSAHVSGGVPTQVGGDFPAPADYGPRAYK